MQRRAHQKGRRVGGRIGLALRSGAGLEARRCSNRSVLRRYGPSRWRNTAPVRLADNLTEAKLAQSVFVRNARDGKAARYAHECRDRRFWQYGGAEPLHNQMRGCGMDRSFTPPAAIVCTPFTPGSPLARIGLNHPF